MTDQLPDPLVPAEVDLRGYEFMPYYGDRLRDSDLNSRATDAEYRAAHNLWWSAWKQVPAASVPDDDVVLARLADLGRDVKSWQKVRDVALRGFVKCSDGRFYHQVLGPLAIEAFEYRNNQRDRTEKARKARELKRLLQNQNAQPNPSVTESTGEDRTGQDIKTNINPGAVRAADSIFDDAIFLLKGKGLTEERARKFIGMQRAKYGDADVAQVIVDAQKNDITDPIPWFMRALEYQSNQTRQQGNKRPSKVLIGMGKLQEIIDG
jgi:hypothetical protein